MLEKMLALQNKRKKEGGFTLVELIVVLVILAILAALLIPALTGYIDNAKQKNVIAETRQCVMAAQTLADEDYANDKTDSSGSSEGTKCTKAEIKKLAEVKGSVVDYTVTGGVVKSLKYKSADNRECTYTDTNGYSDVSKGT